MYLSAFNLISSLLLVLVSYLLILIAILRMNSAEGRRKAFSTCGSHLTVVTVFYGTLIFMYMQPKSSHSFDTDKVASIFYTMVIPMFNPLIYSLRNKDVKDVLLRTWKKNTWFSFEIDIGFSSRTLCFPYKCFKITNVQQNYLLSLFLVAKLLNPV